MNLFKTIIFMGLGVVTVFVSGQDLEKVDEKA